MELLRNSLAEPRIQMRIILACIVLVWFHSVHGGVVNIDTPWLVCTNPILSNPEISSLPAIWTDLSFSTRQILGAEYLPIRDLSVWLDFAIFGNRWAGHHLTNLLLYGTSCILFWKILCHLIQSPIRALFGALFFTVHPTHIESVAWLASRKDVLSLAFVMGATLCMLKRQSIILVSSLCLMAYWSKNTAISLAPILVATSLIIHGKTIKSPKWWIQWLPIAGVFGLGLMLTFHVGGLMQMFAPPRSDSFLGSLSITAQVWSQYAGMLLWPSKLSLLYVEPIEQPLLQPTVIVGLCLIGSTVVLPLWLWKKKPLVALGAFWIGCALLPVSQISPIQNLMADRYLLLPSGGLAIILASAWPERLRIAPPFYILGLGILTVLRIPTWHSSEALWLDVTEKQPLEPRGWSALSGVYLSQGQLDLALQTTRQGLTLNQAPILDQSLGLIFLTQDKGDAAIESLRKAWSKDKQLRKAGNNLALTVHRSGDLAVAERIAQELCELHPLYATGWNTLGAILLDKGELDRANEAFVTALKLDPLLLSAMANLGNVAFQKNDYATAKQWWTKVLSVDPSYEHAYRGIEYLEQLKKEE
ncbi:MAG: tetratricopeptide repeat protein [Myxococcota bacterium]|nr:tetratricopeptide repeat protein [Myxococcota bacterium]